MRHWLTALTTIAMGLSSPALAAEAPPSREAFHLYILAGQSNMAGRGKVEEQDKTPHPRVLVFTKDGQWKPAVDPLHFDKSAAGVGPGLAFGKAMAEGNPSVTIGLIPCAVGGTSLDKWQPGAADTATKTHPYDDAMQRIKEARKAGTLKGLIWHQGEGDSNEKSAAKYGDTLERTMARFRDELGIDDLPIVVGRLAEYVAARSQHATQVDQTLLHFPRRLANSGVASADGLKHKGDNLHFDSSSAREFGRRYAAEMLKIQSLPKPFPIQIWPESLPFKAIPLSKPEEKTGARVRLVSDPTMMVYLPPREKATGTAVVVCPGGGYGGLAIEKEGDVVARWLNELGIAAFVLKYRLKDFPQPAAILDAQQAVRIIRRRDGEWGIDQGRVGIMGFSAGGHLAAAVSNSDPLLKDGNAYLPLNSIETRPNFSILVYGVLPQPGDPWVKEMYTEIKISEKTPPAFLAHAKDDRIPAQLSQDYAAKLESLKIPVELYTFEKGGHGYGLGTSGGEAALWPAKCATWLESRGLLKKR